MPFFLFTAFNRSKLSRFANSSRSDGSTPPVVLKHTRQSVMLMSPQRKRPCECGSFLQTISVFVRRRGLSVRRACLPLGVPSCQARQSSWLHEGLALSRSIGVAATRHIKTKASSFVRACERARACVTFFFLLPSATPAAWGLRCGVSVVNCCFFFFLVLLFLLSPKLFIPATLALTRCLSGWNSSGLKAQSWQQATTHQLGSAVTERRKQKMRYKVTRGRGKGGWGSATALEPHSLSPPEPPLKVVKKRNPRLLRIFPLTAMTGGYTSHRWMCNCKAPSCSYLSFWRMRGAI